MLATSALETGNHASLTVGLVALMNAYHEQRSAWDGRILDLWERLPPVQVQAQFFLVLSPPASGAKGRRRRRCHHIILREARHQAEEDRGCDGPCCRRPEATTTDGAGRQASPSQRRRPTSVPRPTEVVHVHHLGSLGVIAALRDTPAAAPAATTAGQRRIWDQGLLDEEPCA